MLHKLLKKYWHKLPGVSVFLIKTVLLNFFGALAKKVPFEFEIFFLLVYEK